MRLDPQELSVEQFPEQADWIDKLFSSINGFAGDVVRGFRNGLTIEDNLYMEIKEIKIQNTTLLYPYKFTTKFKAAPKGLIPIYLYNNTLSAVSTQTPQVVWSYANNQVSISNISGLTLTSTYTIRLIVFYG